MVKKTTPENKQAKQEEQIILESVKDFIEHLNQDQWTRTGFAHYTVHDFELMDQLIANIEEQNAQTQVMIVSNTQLDKNKNNVLALYVGGLLSLKENKMNDQHISRLLTLLQHHQKMNLVEYISKKILEITENRLALKILADYYHQKQQDDEAFIWQERLVHVDSQDPEIVKKIAQYYEKKEDIPQAILAYKRTLQRYLFQEIYSGVKEVWKKLLELGVTDVHFYVLFANKLAKTMGPIKAVELLRLLTPYLSDPADQLINWKTILGFSPKDPVVREELIQIYKKLYADSANLQEVLDDSQLKDLQIEDKQAIDSFEKRICFDKGRFVYHNQWGVGYIQKIDQSTMEIDFAQKRQHKIGIHIAQNILIPLKKDDIRVIKAITKKDKLQEKVKNNVRAILVSIVKSNNDKATMKDLKRELQGILDDTEWHLWIKKAQNIIDTDPYFDYSSQQNDAFIVVSNPITVEEKIYNRFQSEKNFDQKVKLFLNFIHSDRYQENINHDYTHSMLDYFIQYIKSSYVHYENIVSYLLVHYFNQLYPKLQVALEDQFDYLISHISVKEILQQMKEIEIKRYFLEQIKQKISDWVDIFIEVFPIYPTRLIYEGIQKHSSEKLDQLLSNVYARYRGQRLAFLWIIKNTAKSEDKKWIFTSLQLVNLMDKEIQNKRNTVQNKRYINMLFSFYFDEKVLEKFIQNCNQNEIERLYLAFKDLNSTSNNYKVKLTDLLQNYSIKVEKKTEDISTKTEGKRRGFLTSLKSFQDKQKELTHLKDVEIPKNSKEIGEAMEMGDLRENAEYQTAKDRQNILTAQLNSLIKDLESANVIDKNDLKTDKVNFGTTIALTNLLTNKKESFTIMGPWESDPNHHIISYLSPLGAHLMGAKVGEELQFEINEKNFHYKIDKISLYDFN